MTYQFTRIAVKIGSNVLTRKDGSLDVTRMSALVDQVAELHRHGVEVVLISSGAVASGRSEVKPGKKLDAVSARQLYSAVGQAKLINRYFELFREHKIACGQVLTTKENFGSRTHYLNQKHCMEVMLDNNVIPIVNENDSVSYKEIESEDRLFGDNDMLSSVVSVLCRAKRLVIFSDIDGFYDSDPRLHPNAKLIKEIRQIDESVYSLAGGAGSRRGTGGMRTKLQAAELAASQGIDTIVTNGKHPEALYDIVNGKQAGTLFVGNKDCL